MNEHAVWIGLYIQLVRRNDDSHGKQRLTRQHKLSCC